MSRVSCSTKSSWPPADARLRTGAACTSSPALVADPHAGSCLDTLLLVCLRARLPADFEIDFLEHLGEEECRYVYGSLSRACQLPDGSGRVLALTRTT